MSVKAVLSSFLKFEVEVKSSEKKSSEKKSKNINEEFLGFVSLLTTADDSEKAVQVEEILNMQQISQSQQKKFEFNKQLNFINGVNGPHWILLGATEDSHYTHFRDLAGSLFSSARSVGVEHLKIAVVEAPNSRSEENLTNAIRGLVLGMELAAYQFLPIYKGKSPLSQGSQSKLKITFAEVQPLARPISNLIAEAQIEARSIQLARHLVNLPPNDINPTSVSKKIIKEMAFPKTVKVQIWDQKKLKLEGMNLLLATGKGSETPPCMVHLRYRPSQSSKKVKPVAFIGKGITFDTGGLDIKPSASMRLMKKDMGGAAAVLALAYWVATSKYQAPCDFYLALAENSVDGRSMRPSDLYKSRAGFLVEIDNTDAEGRLVLADVMDVAAKQKGADEPEILIDIATLTGAIKVALGNDVAGLFCNDDELAEQLNRAGQRVGDLNWRMPLVKKYFSALSSSFADFKNSGDGIGGAITAALFLEKFSANKKWAHLDIYAWNDRANGALQSVGGSGQPVQALIEWLKYRVAK